MREEMIHDYQTGVCSFPNYNFIAGICLLFLLDIDLYSLQFMREIVLTVKVTGNVVSRTEASCKGICHPTLLRTFRLDLGFEGYKLLNCCWNGCWNRLFVIFHRQCLFVLDLIFRNYGVLPKLDVFGGLSDIIRCLHISLPTANQI